MKNFRYLIVVFALTLVIVGCGSSKNISYEVTKNICLNASKEDIIKVLNSNNLETTKATHGNGFVVDYKSYSGSKSNNSEKDFYAYYGEWKPNWAYYDFDEDDKLQSVEYTFICTKCTGTEEFFQIANEYGIDDIDYKDYFSSGKITIESGVFIDFYWDKVSERGTITIGLG